MIVAPYTENAQCEWDAFVARAANGTFMHTRRFFSYHPPDRFRDHSLAVRTDDGQLVALLPAAETQLGGLRTLQSHPGASYGGLVIGETADAVIVDQTVAAIVEYARQREFQQVWMRLSEPIFHRRWCGELDVALFRAGFTIHAREQSSAIRLEGLTDETSQSRFHDSARVNIRRALRDGVTARTSDDFAGFWRLLHANLEAKYAVAPSHSLEEILRLRELMGDRVELIGGFKDDTLLSGMVLFFLNDVTAHTMYFGQDYAFKQLRSLHLVVHEAVRHCLRRGCKFLNYGISSVPGSRGLELNEGVYTFKNRLGGEGVVRDILVKAL